MITTHIYSDSWNKLDTVEVKSVSEFKPYFQVGVFNKTEQILVVRITNKTYEKYIVNRIHDDIFFEKRCVKLSYWNYFVERYCDSSSIRDLIYYASLHTTVTEDSCRIYM